MAGWGWMASGCAVLLGCTLPCWQHRPCAAFPHSKLPSWARAVTPRIFYITEKAWNYYPYTITGESCCEDGALDTAWHRRVLAQTHFSFSPPSMLLCAAGVPAEYTVRDWHGETWSLSSGVGVLKVQLLAALPTVLLPAQVLHLH